MTYQSINPSNVEILKMYPTLTDTQLDNKLNKCTNAYKFWKTVSTHFRSDILHKVGELLEEDKQEHARIITLEMGKPIKQSVAEIEKCSSACHYFAQESKKFLKPIKAKSTGIKSYIMFEPIGAIFGIMPWNFPFWQVFRYLAPNFMAGNVCLLKHASNVPQCAEALEILFLRAGAPEGVFQSLYISHIQVEDVIKNPGVAGITLTGSGCAGYKVAELAGKYGKKIVLELGGSDPFIVFESADLDKAIKTGITARFQNTGQSCIAAKRFFIQESVYDKFLKGFTEMVLGLKVGDPMEPDNMIGPIARKDLLSELEEQLTQILQQGGKIITGGKRKESDKLFYMPTVITDLPPDAPVNQTELFGPIIPVFAFREEKDVIQYANQNPFGLGADVWSGDVNQAERVARKLEVGTVAINGMVKSEPGLPFGGVKASGYGRELSVFGMREFVNIKTVNFF